MTPMGARLLRQWLLRPLFDPAAIAPRQAAIGALVEAPAERTRLRTLLRGVGDLERLASRATLGVAHARDLVGLRACLSPLAQIRRAAEVFDAESIGEACAALSPLDELREFLAAALEDEPPLTLHDGGVIRESWHEGLSALVRDAREARADREAAQGTKRPAGSYRQASLPPARPRPGARSARRRLWPCHDTADRLRQGE